jgi:hypothetical protein
MRVRALSPTGDFVFGNGVQNYIANSPQAVAQCVYTALRLLQGEWFLDTSAGVPWLTEVVGFGTGSVYDTIIQNAILGVQGVESIVTYSSSLVDAVLTVAATVATIYGNASVPEVGIPLPALPGYGLSGFGLSGFGA